MVGRDRFGGIFSKLRSNDAVSLSRLLVKWDILDSPEDIYLLPTRDLGDCINLIMEVLQVNLGIYPKYLIEVSKDQYISPEVFNNEIEALGSMKRDLIIVQTLDRKMNT